MTDKQGIPLSVVISPASTHDINLVRRQHLCLDKGYKSAQEEQELIKRGFVLHIPIKKKKRKGKGEGEEDGEE